MRRWFPLYLVLQCLATSAAATDKTACPDYPVPVQRLEFGSRYSPPSRKDRPKTYSQLDAASDRAVSQALAPVDRFISALARDSNQALIKNNGARGQCALSAIAVWARADALNDLATPQAQMLTPSRLAGLAMAYGLLAPLAGSPQQQHSIEAWLLRRGHEMRHYFDTTAPAGVANNNLRAWAGLAATRIGLSTGDVSLTQWGIDSAQHVVCQAAPDGSLPLEMRRGQFALHYQLHSLAPLVTTAALIAPLQIDLFTVCDDAILRAADFALRALNTPELVTDIAGQSQSYFNGTEQLQEFELAWLVPLALHRKSVAPVVFAAPPPMEVERLSHSKLGGRQSLVWQSFSHPLWQPKIHAKDFFPPVQQSSASASPPHPLH